MSSRQEHRTVDVPCVGEVPSTWIRQVGKRNIGKLVEREELRPVVKGLQQELRNLASTCFKALTKLNAEGVGDADIVVALDLCKNSCSERVESRCKATCIAELWRTEGHEGEPSLVGESSRERAAQAVGEKLVDVITEKNKEPPDVSYCLSVQCVSGILLAHIHAHTLILHW